MKLPAIEHYTLNTGNTCASYRAEVTIDATDLQRHMGPLLAAGEHVLPWYSGWTIERPDGPGFVATISRNGAPIVTLGIARDEEEAAVVWPALEGLYLQLTDRGPLAGVDWQSPRRPAALPWLAVVLVGIANESWLGDFERCLAWAWMEKH